MSYIDLKSVLQDWEYDPDRIAVRKILGADGTEKIQLRVELGLLQMESVGRPDGRRPFGRETLLEVHKEQLASFEERSGTSLGFAICPADCEDLCDEVSLYYRRCISLFVLEEFEQVIRDTSHMLGVMDLCGTYAMEKEDRQRLEGFRPYVMMMDARARAYEALADGEAASALAHINRGLLHIRALFDGPDAEEAYMASEEVKVLMEVRDELAGELPDDPIIVTRRALRDAISNEHFEEAARLRDRLEAIYHEKGLA